MSSCVERSRVDKDVCLREEEQRARVCEQSEDRGYRECALKEDQGYRDCCDWPPCSWFCDAWTWVSKVVCVAFTWIANVVCVAWNWIVNVVCVVWATIKWYVCEVISITVAFLRIFAGATPIHDSLIGRPVSGTLKDKTDAWSIAVDREDERLKYSDTGKFVQYKINSTNQVEWFHDRFPNFTLFKPSQLPVFNSAVNLTESLSVSYDKNRIGEWVEGPEMEMIVASSDRVFAKEKDKDNFYIALPAYPFLHLTKANREIQLPQSYYKIDPELGTENERLTDLQLHLIAPNDDEEHLATNRFPFMRAVFRLLNALRAFKAIRELFPSMVVQVHPKVWVKIDTRPAKTSNAPIPSRFPVYEHVVFKDRDFWGVPGDEVIKYSIDFNHVLSMGVGLSHLHEQYEPIYGGEIDGLDEPGLASISFLEGYQFANGPAYDIGGWVDGTCIYYLLVRLNQGNQQLRDEEFALENHNFKNIYTILYADEQFAFTQRWRAIDLDDNSFSGGGTPVIAQLNNEFFNFFKKEQFWDPFKKGYIRSFSRMAVARQVILVNGYDFNTKSHELYSIHFGWPTMDLSWRYRKFPDKVVARLLADPEANELIDVIYPETVEIREDMTIYIVGKKIVNGVPVDGFWVQKYLPSNNQECAFLPQLKGVHEGKPEHFFEHPWVFIAKKAFNLAHQKFSHFGVYEDVNSRCQFYHADFKKSNLTDSEIEDFTWVDPNRKLLIKRFQLSYRGVGNAIDRLLATATATVIAGIIGGFLFGTGIGIVIGFVTLVAILGVTCIYWANHPSLFENVMRLKLKRRDALGWIAVYADKRDDKLRIIDDLAIELNLVAEEDPTIELNVKLRDWERSERKIATLERITPPEIKQATVQLFMLNKQEIEKIYFSYTSAREISDFSTENDFEDWMNLNIYKVKLGVFDELGNSVILFDTECVNTFVRVVGSNEYVYDWYPNVNHPLYASFKQYINENGRMFNGLSLWFENVTGMVNTAEICLLKLK